MILQRTSSLSCAATPLPQTFATGRFYYNSPWAIATQIYIKNHVLCLFCPPICQTVFQPHLRVQQLLPPLYSVLDRKDRPSVLDQSAIRHGDDLGHRVQEFTASITVGSIQLLVTNLSTAGSATAARNRRASPARVQPVRAFRCPNGTRRNRRRPAAPRLPNLVHTSHIDPTRPALVDTHGPRRRLRALRSPPGARAPHRKPRSASAPHPTPPSSSGSGAPRTSGGPSKRATSDPAPSAPCATSGPPSPPCSASQSTTPASTSFSVVSLAGFTSNHLPIGASSCTVAIAGLP